ncbi:MAG: tetratricopeptide repeat protein [Myxococcales bacterium]|nr:tetratricopeptide repeat protein [Myxococcales bacterium]
MRNPIAAGMRIGLWITLAALPGCKAGGTAPAGIPDAANAIAPRDASVARAPSLPGPRTSSPTVEAHRRYRIALAAGSALARKKDDAGAEAAFQRAAAALPDDARALSELGQLALQREDLTEARGLIERAIARGTDRHLLAEAWHRLGRIAERRRDHPGGVEAYRRSVALRLEEKPHHHLHELEPGLAARALPLVPQPANGPFPSLTAWCDDLVKRPGRAARCRAEERPAAFGPVVLATPAPPFLEARLVAAGEGAEGYCHLALRTASGFWVVEEVLPCGAPGSFVQSLDFSTHGSGNATRITLRLLLASDNHDCSAAEGEGGVHADRRSCEERLVVCGVGPSGVPNCTPPMLIAESDSCGAAGQGVRKEAPPRPSAWDWEATPTLRSDGMLTFTSAGPKPTSATRRLVGAHRLRFP